MQERYIIVLLLALVATPRQSESDGKNNEFYKRGMLKVWRQLQWGNFHFNRHVSNLCPDNARLMQRRPGQLPLIVSSKTKVEPLDELHAHTRRARALSKSSARHSCAERQKREKARDAALVC